MSFLKLCICITATLLCCGTERTDSDECGSLSSCRECTNSTNLIGHQCIWCLRAAVYYVPGETRDITEEYHFGHCVYDEEMCKYEDETDGYLEGKMEEAVIRRYDGLYWIAGFKSNQCGEGALIYENSFNQMDEEDCYKHGYMICRYYNRNNMKEFSMCFMKYDETACNNPAYAFIDDPKYSLTRIPPPCNDYLTCNDCHAVGACAWCVVQFDGANAFGRCHEKHHCSGRAPSVPTLVGVDISNVSQHNPAECMNDGMVDSHTFILKSQVECLHDNNLLCNFAEVSSNTGTETHVFDMCFENSRSNCPTTHRIGDREYRVTEVNSECERYSSCRECKRSLIRTGYNCVWCVRGIGNETPFGRCIDSEEEC